MSEQKQSPIHLTAAQVIKVEAYDLEQNSKVTMILDGDVGRLIGHLDGLVIDALKGIADETE